MRDFEVVLGHEKTAFRETLRREPQQLSSQIRVVHLSIQRIVKCLRNVNDLIRRLVYKLQTVVSNSRIQPRLQMPARLLRFRPENSVAATNVCHDRMRSAFCIPQSYAMFLAGVAAVFVASPAR